VPYVAAKAAVNAYTEALHRELARYGIVIKAFLGGKIKTETYLKNVDGSAEFDAVAPDVMAAQCLNLMSCRTLSL
jgi:short-subunit dehydrogenase